MAGRMTEKEKEFMTMQQQQAGMKPDEQQMYYNENRRRGIAAARKADYEALGQYGDQYKKNIEEGHMNPMGDVYKKGGKVKSGDWHGFGKGGKTGGCKY